MVVVCVVCSSSFRGKAWRIPCCECNRPAHRGCISSIPQEIIGQLYKAGMPIDFLCRECSALHNNVTLSDGVPGLFIPAAVEDNLSALHNNGTLSDGVPGLFIPAAADDNLSASIDDNLLASVLSHSLNISNCNLLSSTRLGDLAILDSDSTISDHSYEPERVLEKSIQPAVPTEATWLVQRDTSKKEKPLLFDGMGFR
jgi:hypothetical protein